MVAFIKAVLREREGGGGGEKSITSGPTIATDDFWHNLCIVVKCNAVE